MKNYQDTFSLKNKTCFVLGGSGLLGAETTKAFLDFGAKVICLDIDFERIQPFKREFSDQLVLENFDCSVTEKTEENLNELIEKYSCPDVYVNSSYPRTKDWSDSGFENLSLESLTKNIEINLVSSSWLSRLVAESMRNHSIAGSIIHVGSINGVVGQNLNIYEGTDMEENAAYSIIKGGLISLTRQMASFYGPYNIRVNCVSPGGIQGHIAGKKETQDETFISNYRKNTPMKRLGYPDEIGSSVVFLASEASSYITGTNILIDGGWTSI